MLKVCIDTNIWLSGFFFDGPPAEVVQYALQKRIQVISSYVLIKELERNLTGKFGVGARAAKRLTYRIAQVADLAEPPGQVKVEGIGRADCLVLETAQLGKARYLVTGDKKVLALKHYKYTRIIEPAHLMRLLKGSR
jgi:putative PIN family toxin of toxin-antitoxin system